MTFGVNIGLIAKQACQSLDKDSLIELVRQQANSMAKEGNPYFVALLREIANRYEETS